MLVLAALLALAVGCCYVAFDRSRPTDKRSYEDKPYYKKALAAIERHGQRASPVRDGQAHHGSTISREGWPSPSRFEAGWRSRAITPPVGTPLAGFGARKGKRSTGVHDELFVKALAVSDGMDTAVIVGADMLIIPENIAELVRIRVSGQTALTANEILFNASHTHSGPGAFAPGLASRVVNGPYNRKIAEFLAKAFTEAIVEAYQSLEPAKVTYGSVDAPEYIKNRTRKGGAVDSELSYMLIEQKDADRCFVVSYSAHPTVLGADNMQFTGEYPGFLVRHIMEQTGAQAIYLGGAVGSMGPRPGGTGFQPVEDFTARMAVPRDDSFDRCRAMGVALADKVLETIGDAPPFKDKVDVASIGFPIELPPFQLRLNENWRVSKFMFAVFGIDTDGWMHAVRIGDMALVGTPADYCGEISADLKSRAKNRFIDLWVLSFNGDYVGYISPDRYYYDKDEKGGYGYERGTMSWIGPDQEAFTVSLITHMIDVLFPETDNSLSW